MMRTSIERRIEALERLEHREKRLPTVLPEDTPQAEIDRLRQRGIEALRYGDPEALEVFAP